jgi:repressor LexA
MRTVNEQKIQDVLKYIMGYQKECGHSPAYRKIMRSCRLPNIGHVQRCIRILKERGELESGRGGKIALNHLFSSGSVGIPLIGEIACGSPIMAIENYEGVYRMPEEFIGSGEHFMLRAKGQSMTGAGIRSGDLLIIREQPVADYGQIVAAMIDGEATVKTYLPQEDKIILRAENPKYDDIEVDIEDEITADSFRLLGVLVGCYHKFN